MTLCWENERITDADLREESAYLDEKKREQQDTLSELKERALSLESDLESDVTYIAWKKLSSSVRELIAYYLAEVTEFENLCNEGYPSESRRKNAMTSLGVNASFVRNFGYDNTASIVSRTNEIKRIKELKV